MKITVYDTQAYVITEDKLREGLEEKFGKDYFPDDFRNYKVDSLLQDYKQECYEVVTSYRKPYLSIPEWEVEEVANA